jgi:cation diffusion facilitator family transporter
MPKTLRKYNNKFFKNIVLFKLRVLNNNYYLFLKNQNYLQMAKELKRAAYLTLAANIFLFIFKAAAGIISNSIAVISEAINSLTDIISSGAIMYSVRISLKKPDEDHQFGHNAAQPLSVFLIALFTAMLSINLIEESVKRIITPYRINITPPVYIILVVTVILKLILNRYQNSVSIKYKSPALKATAIDSMNDVLTSSLSIVGIIGVQLGFRYVDGIAGILIALFIFRSAYQMAKENIDYLMGKSADKNLILEIANVALKVEGVRGLNELKSHYVGNKFHVEIHIDVDKNLSTEISHDIGKNVQKAISNLSEINQVFVHIDPV